MPDLRGWSCPGAVAGGFAVTGCASDGETGRPLTPRKRETGRLLTPGASVRWPLRLEGDCREEGSPYWPWVFEGLIWVLGPPGDRRRLRPERFRLLRFRRSRGWTAGRPGSERLTRLPRRMYPLGKGSCLAQGWGLWRPTEPGRGLAERL